MLVQIKNAQAVGLSEVVVPYSNAKHAIVQILQREGYIADVETKKRKMKKAELPFLVLKLKYGESGGVINGMRFISKPSRRMYAGKDDIKKVKSGFGISVMSTSKGIMTGADALKQGIGGEVIFEIW